MTKKVKKVCTTEDCGRTDIIAFGLCLACYHRARYWQGRTMKDKMRHMQNLRVRENAMSAMLGNVRPLARPKRRKAGAR